MDMLDCSSSVIVFLLRTVEGMTVGPTFVWVINSCLSVSELMATVWVVTESGMAAESLGLVEDVLIETRVSTVVPLAEPSHVGKLTPVVVGI